MQNFCIYLLILIVHLHVQIKCSSSEVYMLNENLDGFLKRQEKIVSEELGSNRKFSKLGQGGIDIENSSSVNFVDKYEILKIFTLFNQTFLFTSNEILNIMFKNGSIILQPHSKLPEKYQNISYVRVKKFNNMGIMLIGQNSGGAYVYGFFDTPNEYHFIQKISIYEATDAQFFINSNNLYLIIATNSFTRLYKWMGHHFDNVFNVFTSGAMKLSTFTQGETEFIIILQYLSERNIYSSLYEFKFNKMVKIQRISTNKPKNVIIYNLKDYKYMVIFGEKNTLYKWGGSLFSELTDIEEIQNEFNNTSIIYSQKIPILISFNMTRISMYIPTEENIDYAVQQLYVSNTSQILSVHIADYVNTSVAFTTVLKDDNSIDIQAMSFKVHLPETPTDEEDVIQQCFEKLDEAIDDRQTELNSLREQYKTILKLHETQDTGHQSNITSAAFKYPKHKSKYIVGDSEDAIAQLKSLLDNMNSRIKRIKPIIDSYKHEEHTLIINGKVIFRKPINGSKLIGENIHIRKLNDRKWVPEEWLTHSGSQTITGLVTAKNIITKQLETSSEDTTFKDLVLVKEDQIFTGHVKVEKLIVNEIKATTLNNIPIDNYYQRSKPKLIKGLKQFQNLNVSDAKIEFLNGKNVGDILSLFTDAKSLGFIFDPNLQVDKLYVEEINDVNWNKFINSVFRNGITKEINGTLNFTELKINKLNAKTLGGVKVDDFLTTSTDQVVRSNIEFRRIISENIHAKLVNNISLRNQVVMLGENSTIEGPVRLDTLDVKGDLEIIGKIDKSMFLRDGDHIIGTNESDLLQMYNGKVVIKGNLYLNDLFLPPSAKLQVSGINFPLEKLNQYWTTNTNQDIPVHFEAQNGVSSSHLITKNLNGIPIEDYMLNNVSPKEPTAFFFENVTVLGNIFLNDQETHTPNLVEIDKIAVKTTGSYAITGKKTYTDTLKVENLVIDELQGIKVLDALTTNLPHHNITGKKYFKNIVVKGNLITDIHSVGQINRVDIKKLQENALYVDRPEDIAKLDFENITVENLYVRKVNDYYMNEYILKLQNLYASNRINRLEIDGDVTIDNVNNLTKINDHNMDDLLHRGTKNGSGHFFDIKFMGNVKVNNLEVSVVNDVDFSELFPRLLYRHGNQIITAPHSFRNIKAVNVNTPKVNNISFTNLIDITKSTPQELFVPNGIKFSDVEIDSLNATNMFPCDINEAIVNLRDPSPQTWNQVIVEGNVTFLDPTSQLAQLFEKAVTKSGDNIIYAPVTFANHISTENIIAEKHINDIDIQEILDDAVYKDPENEQIITGHKTFSVLRASWAEVLDNADIPIVNKFLIANLNKSIIHKDDIHNIVIRGKKTFFGGVQSEKLYSKLISNIDPEVIVTTSNPRKIPSAIFESLTVEENLNIKYVNKIDVDYVLRERILIDGPETQEANGTYYFENVIVLENLVTPTINDIDIEDVVFDVGVQAIKAPKRFLGGVEIFGNADIEYINGVKISEMYENAILVNETTNIDGSAIITKPAIVEGNIFTETINGFPVSKIKEIVYSGVSKTDMTIIHNTMKKIEKIVHRCLPKVQKMPTNFMYLEKSSDLQIAVPNALDAHAITTKGGILIHITSEEEGHFCGLPDSCKCPVQHTMEITPTHSINTFIDKGSQRVYSYNNDEILAHFITNSVSTDSTCRTGKSLVLNEVSSLTWNTVSSGNITGHFHRHPQFFRGYVSGAEFFTLGKKTYAVITSYYDPVLDSHNLNCIVLRFTEDKGSVEEIQLIPTKGAWSMYLFHTAQGVTLIIGNTNNFEMSTYDNTEIHRFNENKEQFELLRTVPLYGCNLAAGVTLGVDSLIVLAHKYASAQVLKYYPDYDNYYFYETFQLDAQVTGMSVFYTRGFGISDAYLSIVTANEDYYIYSFRFIEGWKLVSTGEIEGLRNLIYFELNKKSYFFAPSFKDSLLLTVVKHGSN